MLVYWLMYGFLLVVVFKYNLGIVSFGRDGCLVVFFFMVFFLDCDMIGVNIEY